MTGRRHRVLACLAILAVGVGALAVYWPQEPVRIQVRWQDGLDPGARVAAERALGLEAAAHVDGSTWVYSPSRQSRDDLRAIVSHPQVADTHGIDRARFTLRGTEWADRRQALDEAASAAGDDGRVWLVLALVIIASAWTGPPFATVGRWLAHSVVPVIGAPFVLFRIGLGLGLAFAIWYTPFAGYPPRPPSLQRNAAWFADFTMIHALAADSSVLAPLQHVAIAAAVGLAIGWRARGFAVTLAGVLTVLVLCKLRLDSAHDWGLPLLTVWGLAAVRWPSADGRGDGRHAGFLVWWPGFMVALAFFSAAVAKLDASGVAWITSGAVRYHFIQDAGVRATDLSIWIASHPTAAVATSFLAVATEAALLVLAVATPRWRIVALLASVALLTGFNLFQGAFWPAWWALLLSFLPWGGWGSGRRVDLSPRPLRVVATAAGLQLMSMTAGIEIEPFLSNYPMYSSTFASPDEFNVRYRREHQQWRLLAVAPGDCVLDVTETTADPGRQLMASAPPDRADSSPPTAGLLEEVAARVAAARGVTPSGFITERVTQSFDFDRGVFVNETEAWIWSETGWTLASAPRTPCAQP